MAAIVLQLCYNYIIKSLLTMCFLNYKRATINKPCELSLIGFRAEKLHRLVVSWNMLLKLFKDEEKR